MNFTRLVGTSRMINSWKFNIIRLPYSVRQRELYSSTQWLGAQFIFHLRGNIMDETVYQCYYSDCLMVFSTKFNLMRHVNTRHIQVTSFPCKFCGKSLSSKSSMQSHLRTHDQEAEDELPEQSVPQRPARSMATLRSLELPPFAESRHYSGKLPICSALVKKVPRRII